MQTEARLRETMLSLFQEHGVKTLDELPKHIRDNYLAQCETVVASQPPPSQPHLFARLWRWFWYDGESKNV